jgi:putative membrane protein
MTKHLIAHRKLSKFVQDFFSMKSFIGRIIISTLAIVITAYIMPGVHVPGVFTAILVALVLSLLNGIVKPILIFLTLPVTLITLGLFLLVINAFMVMLAGKLVEGFEVSGFWTAFFFSMVLTFVNAVLSSFTPRERGGVN